VALDARDDFALNELAHGLARHFLFRAEQLVEVVEVEVCEKIGHMRPP
jgi:hypothetical protein